MEIYVNILPLDHRIQNLCQQATVHLTSRPPSHPLHQPVRCAAKHYVQHHHSSLHHLFHTFSLPQDDVESIVHSHHSPSSTLPYQTSIAKSRKEAITEHNSANDVVCIYCNDSGVNRKIGAAAHTIYEAEAIGLTLAAKILATEKDPTFPISIYVDNQAVIKSGENLSAKPGHYIINYFHRLV
ncbi:hypothetical protein PAXRUDRAFT_164529 [Paxillus rubicundulus Ve08.2h10]|uniref:RNase H type-1 domain-containing protein n=1 Tax=Paxillus rubicundulus Ve08.2h10 TaxID=930991 RepID=A0A0D0DJB9_9AGAM|nr:hypothetical protein PAXRUDRAFT_164529 [Paxillus rubicundulus Ve08.2h10]